jgi:mannose-6-phosphate isomerase-like protein (cupin superfamily)
MIQEMTAEEAVAQFKLSKIRPQMMAKGKISDKVLRTDMLGVTAQVIAPDGGETNLHAHPGVDSAWIVLDGEATFYTVDDIVVATMGRYDSLLIPGGTPYWFKCTSQNPLVILHVSARAPGREGPSRLDYRPPVEKTREAVAGAFFEG